MQLLQVKLLSSVPVEKFQTVHTRTVALKPNARITLPELYRSFDDLARAFWNRCMELVARKREMPEGSTYAVRFLHTVWGLYLALASVRSSEVCRLFVVVDGHRRRR